MIDKAEKGVLPWPVKVCFVRSSPLAIAIEALTYTPEVEHLKLPLFFASMDCDYYLASAYRRYVSIVSLYDRLVTVAEEMKNMMDRFRPPSQAAITAFNSPAEEAYIAYMEFDAYVTAARTAQDKFMKLVAPTVRYFHKYEIPLSMNDYVGKLRADDFWAIVEKYWTDTGCMLRHYRVLVNHDDRVTPWPSYKYDTQTRALYLPLPSNPAAKSAKKMIYNGPDLLQFTQSSLAKTQELMLQAAHVISRSLSQNAPNTNA